MTTSNRMFSLFSFLSFVLCCIPFPRYMQAWNTGICLLIVWNGLACLTYFINSIVWNSNTKNSAPVWCDISSRLGLASGIGVPTAVLCISRRIYLIVTGNRTVARIERRHALIFDLVLGLGIPAMDIILLYIPQNGRFLIYEDFGCSAFVSHTSVGVVLAIGPRLLIFLVCAVYSILTVYVLYKKSSPRGLNEILLNDDKISTTGYLRLLIIAVIGSVFLVPIIIWVITISWRGLLPWPGWSATHKDMSFVEQVPASSWRSDRMLACIMEITRWEFVFSASLFFAGFGFHGTEYQSTVRRVVTNTIRLRTFRRSGSQDHHGVTAPTAPTGLPLAFAPSPKTFLAFSTNLTRVFADIDGDLCQTRPSSLSTVSSGRSGLRADNNDEPSHLVPSPVNPQPNAVITPPPAAAIWVGGGSIRTSRLSDDSQVLPIEAYPYDFGTHSAAAPPCIHISDFGQA